jgi:hypothetical protein
VCQKKQDIRNFDIFSYMHYLNDISPYYMLNFKIVSAVNWSRKCIEFNVNVLLLYRDFPDLNHIP